MKVENTSKKEIKIIIEAQRAFFRSGETLGLKFRQQALCTLSKALKQWDPRIAEALWKDLHKSYEEAYMTELSSVLGEIDNHLHHLKHWMAPRRVSTPLKMMPSQSKVVAEPLGCTRIMAPWNFPVQLLLNPLLGAISAGCTAVLKPSPYVPHTSKVLEEMIKETFRSEYIAVVQGNREVNTALLEERYDLIFFTGSPQLGRTVMRAASENLTPVVLELGGKSPCIVDKDANIAMAARRIAWGKSLNAGQTCIAPDYLLVHAEIKEQLISALKKEFTRLHGPNPKEAKHFVRIVNERAFDRLVGYIDGADVVMGGEYDRSERYVSPTIIDHVDVNSPIMQEEIFGPIFPDVPFTSTDEAIHFVMNREKPLALYYFSESKQNIRRVLKRTSSGGTCINDTIMHIANEKLPFGGVGASGMLAYHGKESFKVFSHYRSVVTTTTLLDLPFRYMPYTFFKWIKRML